MSESPVTERSVEKSTGSAREYVRAGWSHQAKREFGQAEATFLKALELDAGSVDGHYGLAMTQKMLDKRDQAIATFEKVIELLKESVPDDKVRADMLARLAKAHIVTLKSSAGST